MVPIRGTWTPFIDENDQLTHYRNWGLIPPKSKTLRPIMVIDGYFDPPIPCNVVGYQDHNWAVIELEDGFHAIHGEYLAELQPISYQTLPRNMCFAQILSSYVIIDIETTGFSSRDDRIIEIAAVRYEYGKRISSFHSFINPCMPIPLSIVELTGITQPDVDAAPKLEEIKKAFLHFLGDMPIVGHNIQAFDLPFLSSQLSITFENPVIDTLTMSRKVFDLLNCHKLEYLNNVLNLESVGSHRALNDVETTNALLWACLAPRKYQKFVHHEFLNQKLAQTHSPHKKHSSKHPSTESGRKTKRNSGFQNISVKSITPSCDHIDSSNPLCGKSIVFTGTMSIDRGEAMQMAVNAGAVLKSAVSGKTAYLVVGKQDIEIVGMDGMSGKEEKAHALNNAGKANIQIINEEEFLRLVAKEGASV